MPKSNFFLNDDGIIEIVTTGDRTSSAIQASAEKVFAFAKKLRDSGQPVLILNDVSEMGVLPPEGHKTFADITKDADYDRFALVGSDNITRLGANLIAQAIGKSEELKYFDSREAATKWLLGFKLR
jgi:UDP-N-acetylmuramyl pentapeptide synthase